jgi:hypothetical protein
MAVSSGPLTHANQVTTRTQTGAHKLKLLVTVRVHHGEITPRNMPGVLDGLRRESSAEHHG